MKSEEKVKRKYPNAKANLFTEIVVPGGRPATPDRWDIFTGMGGKAIGNGASTEDGAWDNAVLWIGDE